MSQKVNFDALSAEAVKLRQMHDGISTTCYVQRLGATYGRYNAVFTLCFLDGVDWVARVRIADDSHQDEMVLRSMQTEAAVIRMVKEWTTIPVPTVFGYDANPKNGINAAYMLMSKMTGRHLYRSFSFSIPGACLAKFAAQFGRYLYELSTLRFEGIGNLCSTGNDTSELTVQEPVETPRAYFRKHRTALNAEALERDPDSNATQIACDRLSSVVDHLSDADTKSETYPICQSDIHYRNVLVDDDYNITAVLGWSDLGTGPWEWFAAVPEFMPLPLQPEEEQEEVRTFRKAVREVVRRYAMERNDALGMTLAGLIGSKKSELAYRLLYTMPSGAQRDAWLVTTIVDGYDKNYYDFCREVLGVEA